MGMTAKPYPTDLTDAEWDCIKDLIPSPKPGGRRRELDMRAVVNAIFDVVDGGIKWRMLPHEYPNYKSVYWYFAQWRDSGDWQRLHDTVRAQVRQPRRPTQTSHCWLPRQPKRQDDRAGRSARLLFTQAPGVRRGWRWGRL